MTIADRDMDVLVTIGEQKFSPIAYNIFSVGPFSATIRIRAGEDIQEEMSKMSEVLLSYARVEYKASLDRYTKSIKFNDAHIKTQAGGSK